MKKGNDDHINGSELDHLPGGLHNVIQQNYRPSKGQRDDCFTLIDWCFTARQHNIGHVKLLMYLLM